MRVNDIFLSLDEDESLLKAKVAERLSVPCENILQVRVVKKSVDARKTVRLVYSVDVRLVGEEDAIEQSCIKTVNPDNFEQRPVVVGFGPCGMFVALTLVMAGLKPIVIERGADVDTRAEKVEHFWKTGELDFNTNVQFGEGGAGTFSDGKLTTNTKSKHHSFILKQLVSFGAPEEILYLSKPHIGTDNLQKVVKNLRNYLISMGTDVFFNATMTDIILNRMRVEGVKLADGRVFYTDSVFLAVGHSARDVYTLLADRGISIVAKPFSVGVRIEHRQADINRSQYGSVASSKLPPAEYKLVYHQPMGRSVYTFCMCPGGVVVASSSENGIVTNGMSTFKRDGANANSAILVGVEPEDYVHLTRGASGLHGELGGVLFQKDIEERAFRLTGKNFKAPAMTVGDFLNNLQGSLPSVEPSYKPSVELCDINDIFPLYICNALKQAIKHFATKIEGFDDAGAVLIAPETRSSSPVTVVRGDNRQSVSAKGLYPVGEGCGYAGGIMSSATDGILSALAYLEE